MIQVNASARLKAANETRAAVKRDVAEKFFADLQRNSEFFADSRWQLSTVSNSLLRKCGTTNTALQNARYKAREALAKLGWKQNWSNDILIGMTFNGKDWPILIHSDAIRGKVAVTLLDEKVKGSTWSVAGITK